MPEDQLPVELPDLSGADLKPKGVSPLAAAEEWVNVDCPQCGGPAKRDSDTMDTFVDSSWYFFRYCSPQLHRRARSTPRPCATGCPAAQYVGGVEHAILHLLYSRFFTKVLHDMGMVDFVEPFSALMNQGEVINEGRGMSKSLGNGVNLGEHDRRVRRRRRPADDGLRRPARGRHRLGRHVARRLGEVPAARLAAVRRRHLRARASPPRAATSRCARSRTAPCTTPSSWSRPSGSTCWSRGRWSWSTPPARRSTPGCGPADPAVREAAEAVAILL